MRPAVLRVARIESATTAEGPGVRWALWLQGCSIACSGCCNPHLWDHSGGVATDVGTLIDSMLSSPVEGISLLGGEPFEQAVGTAELAAAAQSAGLGVVTYTGFRLELLRRSQDPGVHALLEATDLLVDGPFLQERLDTTRPWVGSTNQRFIHLTDRYRDAVAGQRDRVEIRLRRDGSVSLNGWPESALIDSLEDLLNEI